MTARDPRLIVQQLRVRYPARKDQALDGISFGLHAGERLGVAGRTGAGKSTLALAAGGFIPRVVRAHLDGTVEIDGISAASEDPAALLGRVGIVFSTPANQLSASKLSVREELAFGLENLGVPRDEMDPRIDAVLDRLRIGHLAEREPFALSGGEQQRVAIASIVAMGTRLLVLDEPTAQLDPAGTIEVARLLAELAEGGTTVLCVEHDPAVLGTLDRVAVLDAGQVVGMDVPGVALGGAVAGRVGLPSPTLVRLAAEAGLDPRRAWDEAALAAALERLRGGGTVGPPAAGPAPGVASITVEWAPRDGRAPVDIGIEGLRHRYENGVEALRGIDLAIRPGEAVTILGQNGSGKTTLVKHLNGLLRPTEGVVRIGGEATDGVRIDRLAATVGFVFQDPDDQLFERSVGREVAFGPRNLGFDPRRTADLVDRALAATGLEAEREVNPYDLDLSRRKLVALASVLAMDPAILVLDEPTTGQDPEGVARIRAIVRAWRAAGRTAIAITHDMEFAAAFDRVVLMRLGAVVADGAPSDILAAGNAAALASTGLTPPPAARLAGRLGLTDTPTDAAGLLALLRPPVLP